MGHASQGWLRGEGAGLGWGVGKGSGTEIQAWLGLSELLHPRVCLGCGSSPTSVSVPHET